MRPFKQICHCFWQTVKQVWNGRELTHREVCYTSATDKVLYGCTCGKMFGKYTEHEKTFFADLLKDIE